MALYRKSRERELDRYLREISVSLLELSLLELSVSLGVSVFYSSVIPADSLPI